MSSMKFTKPIIEGTFIKRYKRFFADVQIGKETVVAHVANSGSMKSCNIPGSPCLVSYDSNPERKLKYTLEMIKTPTSWVGVNTQVPNKIVREGIENKILTHWKKYDFFQAEAKINSKSRLDFVLSDREIYDFKTIDLKTTKQKFHFIEVKNVSLVENTTAMFPDAVTERGQKHLEDLMDLINMDHTTEIVFTVQRTDAKTFRAAHEIDPEYAKLLQKAHKHGVRITPLKCKLSAQEIVLTPDVLDLEI
jgi:sugar fermentation stimulation protein A